MKLEVEQQSAVSSVLLESGIEDKDRALMPMRYPPSSILVPSQKTHGHVNTRLTAKPLTADG